MRNILITFIFMTILSNAVFGQVKIDLYGGNIPNTKKDVELGDNVPEFFFYKAEPRLHNKVFLIIPGGGYARVAIDHEGHDVAKRLQALGYSSFVLRYRLPNAEQMLDKRLGPIIDAQSALNYIRVHAKELGVEKCQVGVLGFSAGGHLASTVSTHFEKKYIQHDAQVSLRPDFSVLVYPVISMEDGVTHKGSKMNLIGPDFKSQDVSGFSNELNVTKKTPPTFLVHAEDDKAVPIENSYRYQRALNTYKVKNELYKYKLGGHGFGMVNKMEEGDWFDAMIKWVEKI